MIVREVVTMNIIDTGSHTHDSKGHDLAFADLRAALPCPCAAGPDRTLLNSDAILHPGPKSQLQLVLIPHVHKSREV